MRLTRQTERVILAVAVVLTVAVLSFVLGQVTSAPDECRDAVVAADAMLEADTALGRAKQDEAADHMAELATRAGNYSALRAECLG